MGLNEVSDVLLLVSALALIKGCEALDHVRFKEQLRT